MSRTVVPTLLCINASYAQHACVCIVSLLENNKDLYFDIVVVSTEPIQGTEEKLKRSVSAYENCTIKVLQLSASLGLALPVRALHYTIDTYTRLWMAEFFPKEVERVLYLDSDVVVVASIAELWATDLGDYLLAAVTIPGSSRCPVYGIPESFGYFQSGVLVVNLKLWRRDRVFDILLDYIERNSALIADADQDVLNACLYDRRLRLPYVWNVIAPFYFNYHPLGISDEELREVRKNARIIHFNGPSKPWNYLCPHPRRAEYWKYLRRTEWRDYRPDDRSFVNWTKKTFGPLLPGSVRTALRKAGT